MTQECETGMPLSYHKGGLTEHNVFVFWFRALVTQTCSSSTVTDSVVCGSGAAGSSWTPARRAVSVKANGLVHASVCGSN